MSIKAQVTRKPNEERNLIWLSITDSLDTFFNKAVFNKKQTQNKSSKEKEEGKFRFWFLNCLASLEVGLGS